MVARVPLVRRRRFLLCNCAECFGPNERARVARENCAECSNIKCLLRRTQFVSLFLYMYIVYIRYADERLTIYGGGGGGAFNSYCICEYYLRCAYTNSNGRI